MANTAYRIKRSRGSVVFDICNTVILTTFSIAVIYPFWQMLVLSFSDGKTASSLGMHLWNKQWITDAYEFLFSHQNIVRVYGNTIFRTVVGTVLIVLTTILGAYPLSKKNLPFRNTLTAFFLVVMFFSGGMIPTYLLVRELGLIDSPLALILPSAVNVFNIIIMRNYFMTIDKTLEESAFMDGANYWTVLGKIIIPLSKPVIATIALWAAVGHWNAWFDALIYIRDKDKTVLQIIVRDMMKLLDTNDRSDLQAAESVRTNANLLLANVRAAAVMVSIGPIILMYPFAQKYFIKGIMIGSLKG